MISRMNLLVVVGLLAILLARPVSAERLINVDPTTAAPPSAWAGSENETDNLWDMRDEGTGSVLVNDDLPQAYAREDAPMLTLTVDVNADLDGPGTYDVWIRFPIPSVWGLDNSGVAAAIGDAALANFDGNNASLIDDTTGWHLYEAHLGQVTSSTTIDVKIDQFGTNRTLPDSVRFMIPEPATLGLTVMGALLMLRRRR